MVGIEPIGYFPRLGISGKDISDLVIIKSYGNSIERSADAIVPDTRGHLFTGKISGTQIVVKPYEFPHELEIVSAILNMPFSLILDFNDRYFVERMPIVQLAEILYANGQISAEQLGAAVGVFLRNLHKGRISYRQPLEGHLFAVEDYVKATDFGAARFPSEDFIDDIVAGLEYLRNLNMKRADELRIAIDSFRHAYSQNRYLEGVFSTGTKRHLKFADSQDPLRLVFR